MTRPAVLLAPAVAGATGALSIATPALARVDGSSLATFLDGNEASTWLAGVSFGVVATLVLSSRPGHRLGAVFAVASLAAAASATAAAYARLAFEHARPTLPLADLATWVASASTPTENARREHTERTHGVSA